MTPPQEASGGRGTLRAALLLAAVLAGTKALHVRPPEGTWPGAGGRWLLDLGIACADDFVYAAALGSLGWVAIAASRRRPAVLGWVRRGFAAAGIASAFYAVMHYHVFAYMRRPLTYPMLYVAGDLANMRDSLLAFVTPLTVLGLAGVPLVYAWLAFRPRPDAPARPWTGPSLAAAAVLWCATAHVLLMPRWRSSHDERQIARNAHSALAISLAEAAAGGRRVTFDPEFGPEEAAEFLPASQRADAGLATPGLRRGPRNVILLVLESVGAEHVPLYGGRRPTMPRLSAEAANCLVFENAYSHVTNTSNSLVALTLGVYPPGLSWREPTVDSPRMAGDSLAQLLRNHGRRTAFISSGDNEYASQGAFLADRGFDVVKDWRDSGRERLFSWGVEDEAMVDMSLAWIDEDRTKPFLVVAWTQGTHHPYQIPWERPKLDFFAGGPLPEDDWDLGNFLNALHETDMQIGRLLDGLAARGLADDTIVVLTGDHGDAFGVPHGNYGHSHHVFEEDVHVPLVFWNPRLFAGAGRSDTVLGHVDVLPTIADLLGIDSAPSWQGRSAFGPARPQRAYFYGALDSYYLGVREGRFKYVVDVTQGVESLFDLAADPLEQTDVSAGSPDLCRALRRRLGAWFRSATSPAARSGG